MAKVPVVRDADLADMRAAYQSRLNTLTNITNANNPSSAEVVSAVKFMAGTLILILKIMAKLLTR